MKKLFLLIMVAVLFITLIACSSSAGTEEQGQTNKYVDGVYAAVSDATLKGYCSAVVTIKDDKIVDVKLFGYNDLGDEKPDSYPHQPYHDAKKILAERFVETNSTDVEIVTQATGSSHQWKQAVERALEKALVEPQNNAKYFNGTFMGASDVGPKGRGVVLVTIENDRMVDVVLRATTIQQDTNKEVFKDESYPYETFHEAVEKLPQSYIEANSAEVEVFTGATGSSNQWNQAVERALESAKIK